MLICVILLIIDPRMQLGFWLGGAGSGVVN